MSKIRRSRVVGATIAIATLVASAHAGAENKRICVEIWSKQPTREPVAEPRAAEPPPGPKPLVPMNPPADGAASTVAQPAPADATKALRPVAAASAPAESATPAVITPGSEADVLPRQVEKPNNLPLGQRPLEYMKRLIEYYVSHEKGFVAVQSDCQYKIHVELYPLVDGWTAFARYTGTGREERVDRLLPGELSQFAERVATALLYGKPISATLNRENVLVSDSKEDAQRVHGSAHFMIGLGTQIRMGKFGTTEGNAGAAVDQYRLFSPVSAFLGYRGRFESWGLETALLGSLGTAKTSILANPGGGNVDFAGDLAMQLHFLHYFDPRGLTSFYLGSGATFELLFFQAIVPEAERNDGTRSNLIGGGVDVDLVLGWEFMRASSAQFYLQAEAQMPAYLLSNQNDFAQLDSWFPAVSIKLGVMF